MAAKKKTPAQLQREIDDVLGSNAVRPDLTQAQRAYVALYVQDVQAHPAAYKADVRADPAAYATRIVDGLDDVDVRQFTRDLRAEMKQIGRHTRHATKKRTSQGRVVGRHGLGTADVRTGEGAYWILTVPTGYRVDYKPWGPSDEVDLGTFPSRRQARAKVTKHAESLGASIVS